MADPPPIPNIVKQSGKVTPNHMVKWVTPGVVADGGAISTAININLQTGTAYTLQLTDNGQILVFNNSGAITVTLPAGMPGGFTCVFEQEGAGQITFTAGLGASLQSAGSANKTRAQYSAAFIFIIPNINNIATNYRLSGDISS